MLPVLTPNRVKSLCEEPYTQKQAEAAVGLRTDNGQRNKIEADDVVLEDGEMEPTLMDIVQ